MKKRGILKILPLLLALASLYCYLQGKLVCSGIFFILIGILNVLFRLPYGILFVLIGLIPILFAWKKIVFLVIVALVMSIIALLDAIQLIRLMRSRKNYFTNKSKSREFLMCLKENEVTYKLWKKLGQRYIR